MLWKIENNDRNYKYKHHSYEHDYEHKFYSILLKISASDKEATCFKKLLTNFSTINYCELSTTDHVFKKMIDILII
jgi:hypothetical protein